MATIPSAVQYLALSGGTLTGALAISGAFPAGAMVTLTNTSAGPTDADLIVVGAASGDRAIGARVSGDTFSRQLISTDGSTKLSSGAAGADITVLRSAANLLGVSTADADVTTAGRGLRVAEGSNAKQGLTAALVGGTLTVANTSVTANSRIMLTGQTAGGTPGGLNVSARTAGTSFTITSTNAADTSTAGFQMFEPG